MGLRSGDGLENVLLLDKTKEKKEYKENFIHFSLPFLVCV